MQAAFTAIYVFLSNRVVAHSCETLGNATTIWHLECTLGANTRMSPQFIISTFVQKTSLFYKASLLKQIYQKYLDVQKSYLYFYQVILCSHDLFIFFNLFRMYGSET